MYFNLNCQVDTYQACSVGKCYPHALSLMYLDAFGSTFTAFPNLLTNGFPLIKLTVCLCPT